MKDRRAQDRETLTTGGTYPHSPCDAYCISPSFVRKASLIIVTIVFLQCYCHAYSINIRDRSRQRNGHLSRAFVSAANRVEEPGHANMETTNQVDTSVPELQSRPFTGTYKNGMQGLSKFHQSILSRNVDRQRFVTGRYPLTVSVVENPTREWLRTKDIATTELLVNGTLPQRSLASLDRFHWLDDAERRQLVDSYAMVSMELIAEIHLDRPGYLQVLPCNTAGSSAANTRNSKLSQWNQWKRSSIVLGEVEDWKETVQDRLWATGFSLAGRRGIIKSVDSEDGYISSVNDRTRNAMRWPNEVQRVPKVIIQQKPSAQNQPVTDYDDAILVSDGFLLPGKDRGGLYIVKNPGNLQNEWTIRLTGSERWFYHRSVWIDLTNDGRLSILTARCQVSTNLGNNDGVTSGVSKTGQLVWLECPKPHSTHPLTGTPLENDGTVFDPFSSRHLPWKEHVLATGPDVMFCVADLDTEDDTIEVLSSHFFGKSVSLSSIKLGLKPKVSFQRVIDDRAGSAFGCILGNLEFKTNVDGNTVIDSGSTVDTLKPGDTFSHLLVTSHECSYADRETRSAAPIEPLLTNHSYTPDAVTGGGGSLFAYRVPVGKQAWKTETWQRTTIASGFKVHGQLNNMINPGAPGFVYTFHARKEDAGKKRPLLAVAGDCAESAYLFRPANSNESVETADPNTNYKLLAEIQCDSTVGSVGIGYSDFTGAEQENGYAKLYIPCYEKDRVLVIALGSGEDDLLDDGW